MAWTEIMTFSHKTITHISTHSAPQISILGILNAAIRVALQIYSGCTGGTSGN